MAKLTAVPDPEAEAPTEDTFDQGDDWEDPPREAEGVYTDDPRITPAEDPAEEPTLPPAAEETPDKPPRKARAKRGEPAVPVYVEPIPIPFDPLGIDLDPSMEFAEWERLMNSLLAIDEGQYWWVGDVFAFGEDHYGEEAFQAFRAMPLKYNEKTIANRAYVSRHVAKKTRRADLSWSHHREVATLAAKDQARLLKRAADEALSCRDLKPLVQALLPKEEEPGAAPQRNRVHAFEIHYSVQVDQAKHGLIVGEQAVALIKDALAERGVEITNLSTNGFELAD
jgi:hypothetical protein